jgi:hypothetical protein
MSGPAIGHGTQPRHRGSDRRGHAAPTTDERRTLTDHVTPHNQDDGLFRTAEQADEQQLTSDVTDVRPVTRPSRICSPTLSTTELRSTSVRLLSATRRRCEPCGFPSTKTTVDNGQVSSICGLVVGGEGDRLRDNSSATRLSSATQERE